MKIVIEIQDYVYCDIQTYKTIFSNKIEEVAKAIKYGTPLPKGHGRLIDADAIIAEATEGMKYPSNYEYMECVIAHMKLAPTIIEADNGSEDKK